MVICWTKLKSSDLLFLVERMEFDFAVCFVSSHIVDGDNRLVYRR